MSDAPADLPLIAALPYTEGTYPDALLDRLVRDFQSAGYRVAGVLQHDFARRDRTRCDMNLEDLASGELVALSEDRGEASRGCRIDQSGLARAAALVESSLRRETVDLLVVNKFGKIESEGGGLRDAIAEAAACGIPVIVGVPLRNLDAWNAFAGVFAISFPATGAGLGVWLGAHRAEWREIAIPDAAFAETVVPDRI
ncbi:MAG TPA: DUF2478 domain-containing protein [Rhabdaerophilum sp.]|nr:DUF2478 domain-containing protein [Rhabdaerophilum sp.]